MDRLIEVAKFLWCAWVILSIVAGFVLAAKEDYEEYRRIKDYEQREKKENPENH